MLRFGYRIYKLSMNFRMQQHLDCKHASYLWKYQALKVIFHSKLILLYENLLECCNIVLLIEHQHRLLIIH